MNVLVLGASGCIGSAVVHALRARRHRVLEAGRRAALHVDLTQPRPAAEWAALLRAREIDAVVNCAGILMQTKTGPFERVHARGPIELFEGAALAGVQRVVQISALGELDTPYLASKRAADAALLALPLAGTVLRPSLVYGPASQSGRLFATLAALPFVTLPGRGLQALAPLHVYELAEIVARCLEAHTPRTGEFQLGGPALAYREMLANYRHALGFGAPQWLPLPMPLMTLGARLAEWLPQRVYSRDTLALLHAGSLPGRDDTRTLLGRAPTALSAGLAITPPQPAIALQATLSAPLLTLLRASVATLWLATAAISLLWPEASGVFALLARCGFEGAAAQLVWLASCALNALLGALTLWRPTPLLYAVQLCAVFGYTAMAAWHVPALTIDHCGPLLKNLPLAALLVLLMFAAPTPTPAAKPRRMPAPRATATPSA
jgi:uncharacterized protein YbjT (DUF2867 family)